MILVHFAVLVLHVDLRQKFARAQPAVAHFHADDVFARSEIFHFVRAVENALAVFRDAGIEHRIPHFSAVHEKFVITEAADICARTRDLFIFQRDRFPEQQRAAVEVDGHGDPMPLPVAFLVQSGLKRGDLRTVAIPFAVRCFAAYEIPAVRAKRSAAVLHADARGGADFAAVPHILTALIEEFFARRHPYAVGRLLPSKTFFILPGKMRRPRLNGKRPLLVFCSEIDQFRHFRSP